MSPWKSFSSIYTTPLKSYKIKQYFQASISPRYDSFVRRRVAIDRIQSNLNRTSNTSSTSSTPNPNPPHNSTPQSVTPNFESNVASSPSDFLFRDYLLPSTTQNIQNLPSSTINIPFHRRINAASSHRVQHLFMRTELVKKKFRWLPVIHKKSGLQ